MSKFKLGVLIGCGIGLAGVAVLAIWMLRDPIPLLSRPKYAAALAKWSERGPKDYDLRVVFSGRQPGNYEVEVRGGEVKQLVRDDEPLPKRGASWHFWTVPGMFDIMAMDLADIEKAARDEAATRLKVSAEFDEKWGFPRRYRRIDVGRNQPTSEWVVTDFTPRQDGAN